MVEYPENMLIKCCDKTPKVYSKSTGETWLECQVCRRRTVNTMPVKPGHVSDTLTLLWNEMMLRSGDPRRSMQGKCAILSLIDKHHYTQGMIAEVLGMEDSATRKYISRIREEFEEFYGDISEDGQPIRATEG